MDDLISRQAAIDALGEEPDEMAWTSYYELGLMEMWRFCKTMLEGLPSAVKHGKWVHRDLGGWHCSLCDEQAPFWCMASTQNLSNYCPNCGARMDG